ncbi:hypothetical protein LR48_Vigan02g203100 [Vigna angularis]|uniref:Uncharacterized protein n=1 Tax=Phaseolus angularis TaxID=3914 RepID=A0A0L9TZE0_PHAAN|nr:hypothetical protein LR48_Vigan02g203100 [Vigna angularis]
MELLLWPWASSSFTVAAIGVLDFSSLLPNYNSRQVREAYFTLLLDTFGGPLLYSKTLCLGKTSISVYVDVEGPVVGGYPDTLIIIQSHVEKDELCGERSRRSWSMFRCGHSEGTNLVNGMKYFGSVFVRKSRSHHKCITSRDRSSTYHPDECLVGIVMKEDLEEQISGIQ